MLYYFAYGSNLHPMRLMERVPSATLVGVVELNNFRLTFHKKSTDGSSKCNLFESEKDTDIVHGAIYEIDDRQKNALDDFEGKGSGYIDTQIKLSYQEREYLCFTYLAQQSYIIDNLRPYNWYKEIVLLGATYLEFPRSYIERIESVDTMEDLDTQRREEKEALIQKIRKYR